MPPDQETWKAAWLHAHYVEHLAEMGRRPPYEPFNVQPNGYLSLAGVSLGDFDFPAFHDDYREMIGFDGSNSLSDTSSVGIKILDSGVDDNAGYQLGTVRDFVDPKRPDVSDETGHGTVVAKIISDLAPDASLHVFKVADGRKANKWNVAAAMGADVGSPVHVINMSLQYGSKTRRATSADVRRGARGPGYSSWCWTRSTRRLRRRGSWRQPGTRAPRSWRIRRASALRSPPAP